MTNKALITNDQASGQIGHWCLVICWSLVLGHWSFAHADSIFVGTLERKNVIIKELRGDMLQFEINSRLSETQASKVTQLVVTTEAPLNSAEEAYAASKWSDAVDAYQKAIRTTSKQWVKDWAAMRLLDAANKSGRFDAASSAYVQALIKDPAAAASMKPTMPDAKSTFLDTAVTDVNNALKDPKLTADQKRVLLGYLVDLQTARKDPAGEESAYQQLAKVPGADPNDPSAKRALARRRLVAANRALDSKNYAQALKEIDADRFAFVDPAQQADALYVIAESRYGMAANDPAALKDAALAYMRVVALAKNDTNRPHVVESLLKTATILEKIGEPQSAAQVYQQILAQYPNDPSSSLARTGLDKIRRNP